MEEPLETRSVRSFKDVFKFYKGKSVKLDGIRDFARPHSDARCLPSRDEVERVEVDACESELNWEAAFGLLQPEHWEVLHFKSKPGLIYIRNPFTPLGQRYWIARSLRDFTKKPHRLNIDAHALLGEGDDEWWAFCQRECNTERGKSVLKKLRWATLGYHHNWDTKEYSECSKSEFPEDLRLLCREIGKVLGFCQFNAEAAIVNLYHHGSSLNGHTDRSELNLTAPLFSFSFGQSAIFLIGGRSIDEEPMPLLLESGDIVVMSSEARLCYHGVPKILNESNKKWTLNESGKKVLESCKELDAELISAIGNDNFWKPFDSYVNSSRINLNVRQVLPGDQTKLSR